MMAHDSQHEGKECYPILAFPNGFILPIKSGACAKNVQGRLHLGNASCGMIRPSDAFPLLSTTLWLGPDAGRQEGKRVAVQRPDSHLLGHAQDQLESVCCLAQRSDAWRAQRAAAPAAIPIQERVRNRLNTLHTIELDIHVQHQMVLCAQHLSGCRAVGGWQSEASRQLTKQNPLSLTHVTT